MWLTLQFCFSGHLLKMCHVPSGCLPLVLCLPDMAQSWLNPTWFKYSVRKLWGRLVLKLRKHKTIPTWFWLLSDMHWGPLVLMGSWGNHMYGTWCMWHQNRNPAAQANCIAKVDVLLQLPAFVCHFQFYLGTHTHTHIYIYIVSHPGVDRISDIFKNDFQK